MNATLLDQTRALANEKRLEILALLKDPAQHFTVEEYDAAEGLCGLTIAERLGIAPATASAHLKVLLQAGLVTSVRIGKFTYFARRPDALGELAEQIRTF
ncbi:ArsR/SmtB family transcription factor [Nocardioides sp. GXZ039]|uniref:ArsR/SmtB family transcription factor n=1 Tax=Nocardioides sp. GXZ039 TaxID=3136018 RepID=UPI0030F3F51C